MRAALPLCLLCQWCDACSGPGSWDDLRLRMQQTGYNMDMRPSMAVSNTTHTDQKPPPEPVKIQFYVTSVLAVNAKQQAYDVTGYLREFWLDSRLSFNDTKNGGCIDNIDVPEGSWGALWQPDVYVDNILSHTYWSTMLRISPDGTVWKSKQVKVSMSCPMQFQRLPYDTQICEMWLSTYSKDGTQVALTLPESYGMKLDLSKDDVEWVFHKPTARVETRYFGPNSIPWTYASLSFQLDRRSEYYENTQIIPCILFVCVAYTGVFIDQKVAPARVAIAIIPVLIIRTLFNGVFQSLPIISYRIFLTDLLFMSMIFSLFLVIEYGMVQVMMQLEEKHRTLRKNVNDLGKKYTSDELVLAILKQEALQGRDQAAVLKELGAQRRGDHRKPKGGPPGSAASLEAIKLSPICRTTSPRNSTSSTISPRNTSSAITPLNIASSTISPRNISSVLPEAPGSSRLKLEPSETQRHTLMEDDILRSTQLSIHEREMVSVHTSLSQAFTTNDRSKNGRVSVHELRQMMRGFGVYRRVGIAMGLMMDVKKDMSDPERDSMFEAAPSGLGAAVDSKEISYFEFVVLLMNFQNYAPSENLYPAFWDKPRSQQLDLVTRACFLVTYLLAVFTMYLVLHLSDGKPGSAYAPPKKLNDDTMAHNSGEDAAGLSSVLAPNFFALLAVLVTSVWSTA